MNVIINTYDGDYRMAIVYDKSTQTYLLVFSSVKNNHGQQYTCASFGDAVNRFEQNCRFYGVRHMPRIPSEQEFLGIPEGVWPTQKKEVTYAKNRA